MLYHILAVGDVVMEPGLRHLERHLRPLQKWKAIDFTVVNGENAAGVGLTRDQAERIYDAGADVVTLGNHAFGKSQIADFLEDAPWLLRPANYTGRAPGRGCGVYDLGGVRIRVLNLIGRCDLAWGADNPFTAADRLLERDAADFTLVDFHAEATSEKLAMGYYLDGRVSALWGTHTHVPTADERVCPRGTGYITDLGMTGSIESVLGIDPRQSVEGFLGGLPGRYRAPEGPAKLQGAIFTLDSATGLCSRGADRRTVTGTISNRLVKISDREERTIMSIEKVRAYFKPLGIEERIREFDVSSATVELAAVAVGVEGARIAKSLSFKVEDKPIIIVVAGDAKVDNSRYKAQFHTKAKMLTHEEAHELIGHDVGGVCPFALPEDVKVYLDVSMKRFETVFPAAGSSNSAVEMTCDELERYASNFAAWVDVCKGWRPEEQG